MNDTEYYVSTFYYYISASTTLSLLLPNAAHKTSSLSLFLSKPWPQGVYPPPHPPPVGTCLVFFYIFCRAQGLATLTARGLSSMCSYPRSSRASRGGERRQTPKKYFCRDSNSKLSPAAATAYFYTIAPTMYENRIAEAPGIHAVVGIDLILGKKNH